MKKLFTLLTMLLVGIGSTWAGPANVIPGKVYTIKALFSTTSYDLYLGESGGNLTFTSNISSDGSSYWIALSTGNKSYPIKFMSLSCPNKFLSPKTYGLTTTGGKFKMANCTTATLTDYTQLYGTYDETDETNNLRNIGTWCYGTKNFYGFGNSNDQHPGCYATSEHSDDYYTTVYDISEVTLNEGELRNRAETIAKAYLITNQSDLIVNTVQFDGYWTCPSEGSLAKLIDGLSADNNFWHSNWESNKTPYNTTNGTNYLGVNIPDVDYATITFSRRGVNGDQITRWSVYGFDENKAAGCEKSQGTKLAEFYTPLNAINETNVVSPVFATKGFTNIRFYCEMTDKTGDGGSNRGYFHLSEFQINGKFETSGTVLTSASSALSSALTTMRDNPTEANLTALTNAYNDYKDAEDLFYAKEFAKNDVVAKGLYTYTEDNESKSSGYPVSIDACTSVSNVNTLSGTLHRRDPSSGDGDFFRIRNAKTGRFLKASSETALALVNENDATGNDCVWTMIGNKLKNIQTGKYLAGTALNTTGDDVVIDNAGNYNNNYYKIRGSQYLRNETSTALSSVSDTNTDPVGCAWSLVDATIHVTYNFTYNSSSKPVSVKACPGDSKSTAVSAAPSYGVTFDAPTGSFSADDDYTVIDIPCTLVNDYPIAVSSTYDESKSYFLKQRKNDATSSIGYAFYDSNRTDNGIEKTEAIGCTNNYLWKFVGNPLSGYQIYNVAKGVDYNLTCSSTDNSITWSENPTYFEMEKMDTEDNYSVTGGKPHVYFKLKGSTSNTLHDLNNILTNWTGSGSVTDAGSILGFYEAEEYDIKITGNVENGRIIINGNEYANGSNFCCQKNAEFTPSAKPISNYQAHEISISGNTISVEYYEVDEYEIEITGDGGNGRIIINDVEYADGQMFYNPKDAEFTPTAKIINYYYAGNVSISGNTISLEYTSMDITVPDGSNGFVAGIRSIGESEWKTEEYWSLSDNWNNYGPGCSVSGSTKGMWSPIYLKDIKGGTVPALDGWNFRMIADHSNYTIESLGKIQGGQSCYFTLKNTSVVTINFGSGGHTYPLTVNLDEGTGNILTFNMSNGYNHACQTDCNGKITVNYGSVSKNTGRVFNASGSGAINNLVLNATLTEPTEKNKVEEIPLVTYTSGVSATVTCNISGTDGWTKATSLKDLKAKTSDGKYYYVEESSSTGVILYTYKLNAPVKVNSGAITVAAEITSGVVSLINTAIVNNKATSVDLTGTTTTEITGLVVPDNCLVIVNNGTTVKDGSNKNIENNVVVKVGENYSCEKLVLTDKVPFKAPVEFTATSITHERKTSSTSAVWGTACLPYPVVSGEGDGIRYYQLSESNSNDGVMSFTLITKEIAANTPVVFIKSSGAEFNFNSTDKSVAITPANPESSENQGMTLVGTFAGSNDVATDDSKDYFYISGNKFWKATGTLKVSPFRAYFTSPNGVQRARNFTLQVVDNGTITSIDSVDGIDVSNVSDEHVYTLEGKKVNNVKKGSIYIIGGNKVVIK